MEKPLIKHIPTFLEYCEVEKGLSSNTSRNYDNFLRVFSDWLKKEGLEGLRPKDLTAGHVWAYRLFLSRKKDSRGQTLKKTSQNYYLIAIRNLLRYFADKDITTLPADKIKLPKLTDKDKAIKFLKIDQLEKLLSMADVMTIEGLRDRTMLEMLFSSGMRISELTSLNIRNFDRNALITGKIIDQELAISGKGGSTRPVYFSQRAIGWLAKYLKTRTDMFPPLFISYSRNVSEGDRRLTVRSVERAVRRYATMAGLPVNATPHTLRHSYATDLLNHGADLRSVQELLGHKNIVTTQIYTHVTNPQLRNVHKKFHSGNKK